MEADYRSGRTMMQLNNFKFNIKFNFKLRQTNGKCIDRSARRNPKHRLGYVSAGGEESSYCSGPSCWHELQPGVEWSVALGSRL